jgi:hypothetical protein
MSGRVPFFQRRKNTVPGILHNSWQRRAEGFQRIIHKGGVAIYLEPRRPPDEYLY